MRLFIALWLPAFLSRFLAVFQSRSISWDVPSTLSFFRGAWSDVVILSVLSIVLGVVIGRVLDKRLPVLLGLTLLSSVFHCINLEHILYNHAVLDLYFSKYALSKTFVLGSLSSVGFWISFGVVMAVSMACIQMVSRCDFPGGHDKGGRIWLLGPAVVLLGMTLFWTPIPFATPSWLSQHVLEVALRQVISSDSPFRQDEIDIQHRYFETDLSGEPLFSYPRAKRNILLIVVEGMGISHLKWMPKLVQHTQKALFFPKFLTLQRQTNRGMYTLLYGDYPNFLSKESKADRVSNSRPGLAHVLAQHGYKTRFFQSAPLSFMRKDLFASRAGFEVVKGYKELLPNTPVAGWGLSDAALFEFASLEIDHLESESRPWFLTLLTVGTHPPYIVPNAFLKGGARKQAAYRYLDWSLSQFLERLNVKGILQETAVFITSDEVGVLAPKTILSEHRGVLLAILPEKHVHHSGERWSQADFALSITDYLGVPHPGYLGRSLFRQYNRSRSFLLGNVYTSAQMVLEPSVLSVTRPPFEQGRTWAVGDDLETLHSMQYVSQQELHAMRATFEWNEKVEHSRMRELLFYDSNKQHKANTAILQNHIVSLTPNDVLKLHLKGKSSGNLLITVIVTKVKETGASDLFKGHVHVKSGGDLVTEQRFKKSLALRAGEPFELNEQFTVEKAEDWLYVHVLLHGRVGGVLTIDQIALHRDSL